jgi:single-stranded DNA-binding protein
MSASPSTSTSTPTTTLFGFLGKDPIERFTPERTKIVHVPDPILDDALVEKEVTVRARAFWKLSVATHPKGGKTCWHDCIVWNPEHRTDVQNAYLARKGDQVTLSGRHEEYSFTTADGQTISGVHFVVESFHFKRLRKPPLQIA